MAWCLQLSMHMATIRQVGVFAIVGGSVVFALSRLRRAHPAKKISKSRRFVSRRSVDRDARDSQFADRRDAGDNDGGAGEGPSVRLSDETLH
jgi:hypothetical protein